MSTKKVVAVVVAAILVLIVALVIVTHFMRNNYSLTLQGEVDATEHKISSKLPGRIDKIAVREGQKVKKGDLIFVIGTPEVDFKLQQAEAMQSAAQAQMRKVDAGAREQTIQSARAVVEEVRLIVEFAQKSFDRVEALYNEGVVAQQKRDEVKMELDIAKQKLYIATQQYEMAVEGARKEDKAAVGAMVKGAEGAVGEVKSYLADASQYAPIDGEVSGIIAQEGELVGTGYPVVTLIDMSKAWITFNVKEDLLPRMKMDDTIEVYVPGLGRSIELIIGSIAVQADYATWSSTRSKGGFDVRTFEIKAYPINEEQGLRVGMTAIYELPN